MFFLFIIILRVWFEITTKKLVLKGADQHSFGFRKIRRSERKTAFFMFCFSAAAAAQKYVLHVFSALLFRFYFSNDGVWLTPENCYTRNRLRSVSFSKWNEMYLFRPEQKKNNMSVPIFVFALDSLFRAEMVCTEGALRNVCSRMKTARGGK